MSFGPCMKYGNALPYLDYYAWQQQLGLLVSQERAVPIVNGLDLQTLLLIISPIDVYTHSNSMEQQTE